MSKSLENKIILITGGHSGIGFQASLEFAKEGATVILASHDLEKANIACQQIILESSNQNIQVEPLDLSSLQSIREFAERFKSKFETLDILVNNSCIRNTAAYTKTDQGRFEIHFMLNYLSHFYLTNLLIDLLKKSAPSRILNISCEDYNKGQINWDDLQLEENYSNLASYNQSKLAQILFNFELNKKLEGSGVSVVAVNSGVAMRDLFIHREGESALTNFLLRLTKPFICTFGQIPSDDGLQTIIYCATAPNIHSGGYYVDCDMVEEFPNGVDEKSAAKLWEISSELVGFGLKESSQ